jgi:CheY-like chemotaxis protein
MSHELRTPLNSLLILSKLLADNPQGNLNEKQTEFARTINSAGSDLLSLINDILDLSKIESGTVSIEVGDMPMSAMKQHMERTFRQLAQDKGLRFDVVFDPALPASIRTDEKRLQQVVLNLLSNAFKFTAQGGVTLSVAAVDGGWSAGHPVLHAAEGAIAIAVTDTGIGIPEDKQKLIFEAFQQADGTTSRKYGGTGLGLSISREIARMLGGELQVRSKPGEGSTFTLFVPLEAGIIAGNVEGTPARYENSGAAVPLALPPSDVVDDREALGHDPFVLIVEDDATFASILLDLAREAGLKGVVSTAGAGTLALARKLQPDAITLDLGLNDIDGFVLLDLLKHDPQTQHLPIHVISGAADIRAVSRLGAFSITEKPADRSELIEVFRSIHAHIHRAERRVLVIGGQANDRKAIGQIVADPLIEVESAATLARAQEKFGIDQFDLIVLAGGETAAAARDLAALATIGTPLLVASKGEESAAMQAALAKLADTRDVPIVHSLEALPGAVAPALRRGKRAGNDNENPAPGREAPELAGAKILIVDDDIRNIFSLTSVLESFGAEVMHAERGRDGIRILEETPGIAIALIDIMMPEMDGYETMQQIRQRPMLADVPLVAVTAKAMKGDRQKCLDAGASDYIAKPVDIDLLLALLRVWIDRSRSRTVLAAEPIAQSAAE